MTLQSYRFEVNEDGEPVPAPPRRLPGASYDGLSGVIFQVRGEPRRQS